MQMWKHANGSINVEKALVAGRSNMKRCNVANVALKYREGGMPRSNIIYMKRYISNKSNISIIKYEKMQCGFKLKRRENAKVRAISYLPVKFSTRLMQSFHSLLEFGAVQ